MAYESGSATSRDDLLDKIRGFALANGWTVNGWADDGGGKRLHIQKGTLCFNFRSGSNEPIFGYYSMTGICMNGSSGYDGAQPWYSQPGHTASTSGGAWGVSIVAVSGTIPAYHFFTLGSSGICIVVEYQVGKYKWLVLGELDKAYAGNYSGGQFISGSDGADNYERNIVLSFDSGTNWRSSFGVYLDIDGQTGKWRGNDAISGTGRLAQPHGMFTTNMTSVFQLSITAALQRSSYNAFTGLTALIPIYITAERDGGFYSYVGKVPNMRLLNIRGLSPGDEITLGSDTWKVFPVYDMSRPDRAYAVLKS